MNGHVIVPNLIAVDYWKENAASFFFLTHCHGDHVSPKLRRWPKKIYTSKLNCEILQIMYDVPQRLLVELPLGETVPVGQFQVTALDAYHCPGSIQLLFQGDFGSILYTGDLRFLRGMPLEPALQYLVSGAGLDRLFLDNTYCSPECVFPRRDVVLRQVIKYLRECDNCDIYIGMRELGKEDAVLAIAEALQTDVVVSKSRLRLLRRCAPSPRWTADPRSAGRVHLVPFRRIAEFGAGSSDTGHRRVALLLTALFVGSRMPAPYSAGRVQVFPYSDHSSFPELCELVRRLRPRRVLPLVKRWAARGWHAHRDLSARADMSVFRTYLRLDTPPREAGGRDADGSPDRPPALAEAAGRKRTAETAQLDGVATREAAKRRGGPSGTPSRQGETERQRTETTGSSAGRAELTASAREGDREAPVAAEEAVLPPSGDAAPLGTPADSGEEENGDQPCPFVMMSGQLVRLKRVLVSREQVDQWLASCNVPLSSNEVTSSRC